MGSFDVSSKMRYHLVLLISLCLILELVHAAPAPQRRRRPPPRHRGRGPPPPRYSATNNYVDNILPLKVAGGVGLAAGYGLATVLNG